MQKHTTSPIGNTTNPDSPGSKIIGGTNNIANDTMNKLFTKLYDVRFGSLWWAREDFVDERTRHWTSRADRKGHPVLVLRTKKIRSLDDRIPLAVGTSQSQPDGFSFVVTDDRKRTYFSFDHVAWATPRDFLFRDRAVQRDRGEGFPWETSLLWRNDARPSIGKAEAFRLRDSLAFAFWSLYAA